MHKFYLTNNLGGGGTNVSRFVVYRNLFQTTNIGVLFNYYYLSPAIAKDTAFDQGTLSEYNQYENVHDFIEFVSKEFRKKNRYTSNFASKVETTNLNSFLLDNGAGNIIRDLITRGELNDDNIDKLIQPFHQYAQQLKFDIVIALDYALKYTYKKGEKKDDFLNEVWKELASNEEGNLELLKRTLIYINDNKPNHKVFAPIHGFDFASFNKYLHDIRAIENELALQFDGYALGGIASTRELKDEVWNVPDGLTANQKSAWIVSNLCKQSKNVIGDKPLHVLGAGNIFALPFLTYSGATSSDCHSPWRRASDGEGKIMIPLFDEELNFINSTDVFSYVKLSDLDENKYNMNFSEGISFKEVKKMYYSSNKEDEYFAKIYVFYTAIKQYDLLIEFIKQNPESYLEKLTSTPDQALNEQYDQLINLIT